jgi:predicted Zn-dependent protease
LLDRVLASRPNHLKALAKRGRLALDLGQLQEAETWLRRAQELGPSERETLYSLYRCLLQLGKADEAKQYMVQVEAIERDQGVLKQLTRQIMTSPHDAALSCEAGRIMLRHGQEQDGLRWLESALHEDPRHGPTHQALAEHFAHRGDVERAASHRQLAEDAKVRTLIQGAR